MIHYYSSREISIILKINLARWKRWSRSFLPPDPLGGMQSGYARQYTFKDLFKVYLGGHLLSHVRLSAPDTQQVLADLSPWLKKNGFVELDGAAGSIEELTGRTNGYRIYFCPVRATGAKNGAGFCYLIRKTVSIQPDELATCRQIKETVQETIIPADAVDGSYILQHPNVHMINLSPLFAVLLKRLYHQPQ